jgi:mannose-6-phosphate isomerase-like protein (cupin superfamily)
MTFTPEDLYVHLSADGLGRTLPGGEAFWSLPPAEMADYERGWLVSEFVCSRDWPNWEMHPGAEEFVYLLSGDIEFLQDLPSGVSSARITDRGAVLVPRGVWHTARVFAPSRMLLVTMGEGTQHRPAVGR